MGMIGEEIGPVIIKRPEPATPFTAPVENPQEAPVREREPELVPVGGRR